MYIRRKNTNNDVNRLINKYIYVYNNIICKQSNASLKIYVLSRDINCLFRSLGAAIENALSPYVVVDDLSLVSIWSSRSSQSSQKLFRALGCSYGNATQMIARDLDNWDDLARLDRIEFYPDDRDGIVSFEAIIWKSSQTTETIEGFPEVITLSKWRQKTQS